MHATRKLYVPFGHTEAKRAQTYNTLYSIAFDTTHLTQLRRPAKSDSIILYDNPKSPAIENCTTPTEPTTNLARPKKHPLGSIISTLTYRSFAWPHIQRIPHTRCTHSMRPLAVVVGRPVAQQQQHQLLSLLSLSLPLAKRSAGPLSRPSSLTN